MSTDILCIGNALVDVISNVTDDFLCELGLSKGSMNLVGDVDSQRLLEHLSETQVLSGGSVANTAAGISYLGGSVRYVGKVANDAFGTQFLHDLDAAGVAFSTSTSSSGSSTGNSVILVTPDGERTMNTHLGAAHELTADDIDENDIASAKLLFLEAYLFDHPSTADAAKKAIALAYGRTPTAVTLSDAGCAVRHRQALISLIDQCSINIVLANQSELQALFECSLEEAISEASATDATFIVTRGSQGATVVDGYVHHVPALKVDRIVDLIGAGDAFASGCLRSLVLRAPLKIAAEEGVKFAAKIIQQKGARLK